MEAKLDLVSEHDKPLCLADGQPQRRDYRRHLRHTRHHCCQRPNRFSSGFSVARFLIRLVTTNRNIKR